MRGVEVAVGACGRSSKAELSLRVVILVKAKEGPVIGLRLGTKLGGAGGATCSGSADCTVVAIGAAAFGRVVDSLGYVPCFVVAGVAIALLSIWYVYQKQRIRLG